MKADERASEPRGMRKEVGRAVKGSKTGSSLAARTEETRVAAGLRENTAPATVFLSGFYTAASRRGNVLAY